MKKIIVLLLISSVFLKTYSQQKFMIGVFNDPFVQQYWNDTDVNIYQKRFEDNVSCGINFSLGMSYWFSDVTLYQNIFGKVLNTMHADYTLYLTSGWFSEKSTTFDKHILSTYIDSLSGYSKIVNLGDEPLDPTYVLSSNDFVKINYPYMKTFVNLYSIYKDSFKSNEGYNKTISNYQSYLNQYKNADPAFDYIAFDYYPFKYAESNGEPFPNEDNNPYYINLALMQSTFSIQGFLSYVGCNRVHGVRSPNTEELNKTVFCPLAYGSKGIIYYDSLPEITSTLFNRIRSVDKYISKIIGPVIMGSSNCLTLHSDYNNNDIANDSNKTINQCNSIINNVNKNDILFGIFTTNDDLVKNKSLYNYEGSTILMENDNTYILVVNKSLDYQDTIKIGLNGDYRNYVYLAPHYIDYSDNQPFIFNKAITSYDSNTNTTNFEIPYLDGGEGLLIKIPPKVIPCPADYDGDGFTDLAVLSATGQWRINYAQNGYDSGWDWWSNTGDFGGYPVPGKYNNDASADLAVKTYDGQWKVSLTKFDNSGVRKLTPFDWGYTGVGNSDAHPAPADYNRDGLTDISVKTDLGYWKIKYTSGYENDDIPIDDNWDFQDLGEYAYGDYNAQPVPADYDGDGYADLSVKVNGYYGTWLINRTEDSRGGLYSGWDWGDNGYGYSNFVPVPADYNGDGRADISVKINSGEYEGYWKIKYSPVKELFGQYSTDWDEELYYFGDETCIPVPADYDNDGSADLSYRSFEGTWYIMYKNGSTPVFINCFTTNTNNGLFKSSKSENAFNVSSQSKIRNNNTALHGKNDKMEIKNVYPIPCKTKLYIDLSTDGVSNAVITISNINGVKVKQSEYCQLASGLNKLPIDCSDLKSGFYYLNLRTGKYVINRKIVIEK